MKNKTLDFIYPGDTVYDVLRKKCFCALIKLEMPIFIYKSSKVLLLEKEYIKNGKNAFAEIMKR